MPIAPLQVGLEEPTAWAPQKDDVPSWTSPRFRYVEIMTPNPKFVDGTWINREGDMEATFYVPQNRRKRFEELFEGYAGGLGVVGSIEFLP